MKYLYSQLNPEWGDLKMGKSGLTLKQAGCLLTNCAMIISDLMGEENTPEELLLWMNIFNGFTPTGELKWEVFLKYPIDKMGLHQGKANAGETEYRIDAVWAGQIKHWILKDGDKWIDPLTGGYISMTKYKFYGDIRILSGRKLQIMPNYEKRIVQNTEAGTPEAGQFAFIQDGKRRVISQERAGLACLTIVDKEGEKVFALNSKDYHAIPRGKDF